MSDDLVPWPRQLHDQLEWHWTYHLRSRLEGLTDEEYFREPVPGCWNVRPEGTSPWPRTLGTGSHRIDLSRGDPDPAPFTTIAWRMAHLIVGVFGERAHSHFDGPPIDYASHAYAGSAAEAIAQLEAGYELWAAGVRRLDERTMDLPVGEAEGPFAPRPMSELVLHINREAIHHGAEIALLRDLYRDH